MMTMEDTDVKENAVGLPEGWEVPTLGTVCEKVKAVKRKEVDPEGELIYLDIGGLDNDRNIIREHKIYQWKDAPSRAQQIVEVGDVLFSTVRTYMKNIALVDQQRYHHQIASSGFCVLRPQKGRVASKYIFYYSISQSFLQPLNELQTGSSYPAVRDKDVFAQEIPLPPLAEQERIVSKIEELFSELEKGKEQILLAQQQLKTYRQAVLKWAFEGRLTDEWRKIHPEQESGRNLLAQIKTARDNHAKITGRKIKIIPDVTLEEMLEVVELPESWTWTKLNEITYQITDGTHLKPTYMEKGMPFLSVKNVRPGLVRDADIKYISREQHDDYVRRCKPEKGDILYTKVGATYGYAAINNLDYEFSIYVSLCLVKFPQESIYSRYLEHCMNSRLVYRQAQDRIKGIGRPDLHLEEIRDFYVPICSFEEQHRIVQEIESRLSVCDAMEATLQASLGQVEVLRQSVLKRAFEGKLI